MENIYTRLKIVTSNLTSDLSLFVYAKSLSSQMQAVEHSKTSPADGRQDKDEEKLEPQRYSNLDRQLPTLLTSRDCQPVFTQQQLDAALYGYAKSETMRSTTGHELSGLRPTSLSYGSLHFIRPI